MHEHLDPEQLLDAARAESAAAHAAGCAECRRLLDGLRRMKAAIDDAPPAPVPPALAEKIERGLRRRRWIPIGVPSMALAAVLAFVGTWWLRRPPSMIYQKRTVAEFGDDTIDGDLLAPDRFALLGLLGTPRPDGGEAPTASLVASPLASIDRDSVRELFQRHRDELRTCYELELGRHPTLAGKVVLEILVHDGKAEATVRSSTLGSPPVEECLKTAISRWSFPKWPSLVRLSYPITFRPPL